MCLIPSLLAIFAVLASPARSADPIDRITLAEDGASAVLWAVGGSGAQLLIDGDLQPAPEGLPPRILALFPHPEGWIGLGTDDTGAFASLFHLSVDISNRLALVDLPIKWPAAADLRNGLLYVGAASGETVEIYNPCLLLRSCAPAEGPERQVATILGPPLTNLAADPASGLAVLVPVGWGGVLLADTRSRKGGLQFSFRDAVGPMTLALSPGEAERPGRVYVGLPDDAIVLTAEIDAEFRELRPTGTISLADFAATEAPVLVKPTATTDLPFTADRKGTARIAASDDGRLILVAGRPAGLVHVLSLASSAVVRIADLQITGPVVDLDVSADGRFGSVLSQGGVTFLKAARLTDPSNVINERDKGREARIEAALTAAVQARLAAEGFLSGVIDGILGPQTRRALERYAAQSRVPLEVPVEASTLLPPELLAQLFLGHTAELPAEFVARPEGAATIEVAFAATLAQAAPELDGIATAEFLTLGEEACARHNTLPPELLWPNLARGAQALAELRKAGLATRVVAAHQSPEYAACAGTPEALRVAAADFRVLALEPTADPEAVLRRMADVEGITARFDRELLWIVAEPGPPAEMIERLGRWHAVIASHNLNPAACRRARDDVAEFARLLAGTTATGLPLYIARTVQSPYYAVTVDTGDDAERAREVSALIRKLSAETADRRTGADSIVLTNRGWSIDPACRWATQIGSAN